MSRKKSIPIQRGEGPSEGAEQRMKTALARAKEKGKKRELPGDLEGTPRFDELPDTPALTPVPGADQPPGELSKESMEGLEAVNEAMRRQLERDVAAEPPEPPEELTALVVADRLGIPVQQAEEVMRVLRPDLTLEARARKAVEERLEEPDIGQYLMSGILTQRVPIVPDRLEVVFQTIGDAVEVWIDTELGREASQIRKAREEGHYDSEMSQREYVRRQNEWAVAVHMHTYQGNRWPRMVNDKTGEVDDKVMEVRLKYVRQLSSPIFALLSQNLGWFLERVTDSLNMAVLGNG